MDDTDKYDLETMYELSNRRLQCVDAVREIPADYDEQSADQRRLFSAMSTQASDLQDEFNNRAVIVLCRSLLRIADILTRKL